MRAFTDDVSICTIIGAGSSLDGNLSVTGAMMIDGDINGDLSVSGNLIIGATGRIRGNVKAKAAVISGTVLGNVSAPESIVLNESATIIGDVTTRNLQVAAGVVVHGHCVALSNKEKPETKRTIQQEKETVIESEAVVK